MDIKEIRDKIFHSKEYDFLKTEPLLENKIIFLTLGGSHAYGTAVENSDIDLRGCALNSKKELLTHENFEQFVDDNTDTTIYAFNKLISLLCNCNPNCIELLGCKPQHYFYINDIGRELLFNKKLFLSQRAAYSFGGYANAQLQRLSNKAIKDRETDEREKHILKVINHTKVSFPERYFDFSENAIELYIDKSYREGYDTEIYMDIQLQHYPLRDYKSMWSEMNEIVKPYSKVGKRNKNAIVYGKIAKHMMHLIRLFIMGIDILEKEEIITYRKKEHNLLMDIREGKFLNTEKKPNDSFYDLVNEYEKWFEYAKQNTSLPKKVNMKEIGDFVMSINEKVVRGELINKK